MREGLVVTEGSKERWKRGPLAGCLPSSENVEKEQITSNVYRIKLAETTDLRPPI